MDRNQALRKISEKYGLKMAVKMSKNIGTFTKIYNNLCRDCQIKVFNNPSMDFNQYCDKCKASIEKLELHKIK
jgi:hypothetical protein